MSNLTIAQKLNVSVSAVIGQHHIKGFEKAFLIAEATQTLKELLTPEYMKPIMQLQGNKLGFKTDKIYSETVVKDCLIEAVLTGLQPHGNQFNIIAGNMYPTKEGIGYLLDNYKGLSYQIKPELPRMKEGSRSAAVVMNIKWQINGGPKNEEKLDIPIKVNKMMGTDAVIGKGTRKARHWLYTALTGSEISDGDVDDLDSAAHLNNGIETDPEIVSKDKEYIRVSKHIDNAKTLKELYQVKDHIKDKDQQAHYDSAEHALSVS